MHIVMLNNAFARSWDGLNDVEVIAILDVPIWNNFYTCTFCLSWFIKAAPEHKLSTYFPK